MPTFTYIVYANIARDVTNDEYRARVAAWGARPWTSDEHQDYALSTYNYHHDGSGIAYSSRLRPILNLRSAFLAYVDPRGSGVRHLPADLYLLDWLEQMGHRYDVVTDEDLHAEGLELLALVQGGPHADPSRVPEPGDHGRAGGLPRAGRPADVPRRERLLLARRGAPGRAGGAGGAARRGRHPRLGRRARRVLHEPGRRSTAGSGGATGGRPRSWPAWDSRSQGPFDGSYYRRLAASRDPRVSWIFDGVPDEILGDFGLSGGGAAGFELDRADPRLGTPPHAIVLASSEKHDLTKFVLVPEDWLTHVATWPGDPPENADPGRHGVLRDAERRGRLLGRVDHLLRQPLSRWLPEQHLPPRRQRPPPLRGAVTGTAAAGKEKRRRSFRSCAVSTTSSRSRLPAGRPARTARRRRPRRATSRR